MEEKQWQQLVQNLGFLNNYIAERLATFERKVLIRMSGGIKVHENWRKRYNEELMQLL
jgi:hypothetical protein